MAETDCAKAEEIENFYGVYLLVSQNVRYKGRTYVGFTVDPIRRLKQHNGGCEEGGARKTNNRGPWAMVMIVFGFPNMISALRFEWAWQHPQTSRRLNHLPPKLNRERSLQYHIKILSNMLNIGPWNRLPLNIRWLRPDLREDIDFNNDLPPPMHMSISYGEIIASKKKSAQKASSSKASKLECDDATIVEEFLCGLCVRPISDKKDGLTCISPRCKSVSHMACLAEHFRQTSQDKTGLEYLLPVDGTCPVCDFHCLWGDIIKKKKGCYEKLPFKYDESADGVSDDEVFA